MDTTDIVVDYFKKRGYYNEELKYKTIINDKNEDFMDMECLFESFFKDFNIKNSNEFNVNKYFYNNFLIEKFLIKIGIKTNTISKPSITIAHMIEVAKRQKWFDPE
ncbi:DUF1493 family protein [Chryseobacterium sp. LAM-KRS1]|uniref:DUF1493 family protein n=1 Tax=Chryseobacterium sp. LAM-KRS1 TaxID=2715754 RepID=UPI0015517689|nr:DUF1493 family protein [Chryseobacterium sp. LAM-KRS1]